MNPLEQAIIYYNAKNYAKAIRYFEKAGETYGMHLVDLNLKLCRRALVQNLSAESPPHLISDFSTTQDDMKLIRSSGLFDENWYINSYPEVKKAGIDPIMHYLIVGAAIGYDSSPDFSTSFYLDIHPSAARNNLPPLVHLLRCRQGKNGKDPSPVKGNVLWAAQNIALKGQYDRAIQLAERYITLDLSYAVNIFRANSALSRGSETEWLKYLNTYLAEFCAKPVSLSGTGSSMLDRLTTAALPRVEQGPLVSVIMPAWNAETTISAAARSILNQTWLPLELFIIDDASVDGTWAEMQRLAANDKRVRLIQNKVNVGPYVSKNIALMHARGDYVTGHDADDWAHPTRLECHIKAMLASDRRPSASLTYMIRMNPQGYFSHIGKVGGFSLDGIARKSSISCLFERMVLKDTLGFWDSVRFGADSEMIARSELVLGDGMVVLPQVGMICLDIESSLTNHPEHGVSKTTGISDTRKNYRNSWAAWHRLNLPGKSSYLEFPLTQRRYDADEVMMVNETDVNENIRHVINL